MASGKERQLAWCNYSLLAIRHSLLANHAASARPPFSDGVIAPEPLISATSLAE